MQRMMRGTRHAGAGKPGARARAAVLLLAYLALVLGLPGVHLLRHRPDHDHAAGGVHWHAAALGAEAADGHGHGHAAHPHHHEDDHDEQDEADGDPLHGHAHDHDVAAAAPDPRAGHAHPHPHPHAPDAGGEHGAGSVSHWACAFLSPALPGLVPARARVQQMPELAPRAAQVLGQLRSPPLGPRGPPQKDRTA